MSAETTDVISDCLQLQEVVVKFNKYSAPPFVKAGTLEKRYTVIWEKVDRVGTNESMLGYKLEPSWNGNPSGVRDPDIQKSGSSFLELDCLANGQIQGDGHLLHSTELKADVRGSDYKSEEICIPLADVFSYTFPGPFPKWTLNDDSDEDDPMGVTDATALCPNNATAIFDNSSFLLKQNFSENYIDNEYCDDYGCGKDLYVISEKKEPLNMLNYYRPDWVTSILTVSQCYTLYSIYIATIVFFSFSAA